MVIDSIGYVQQNQRGEKDSLHFLRKAMEMAE